MIRAALDDRYHPAEGEEQKHIKYSSRRGAHPCYVGHLRAHFMRMFIDFVPAPHLCGRNDYAPGRFPDCHPEHMQNLRTMNAYDLIPALIYPGGPSIHAFP